MITISKEVVFYCDYNLTIDCLQEYHAVLFIHERKDKAWGHARKAGWVINDNDVICPVCYEIRAGLHQQPQ